MTDIVERLRAEVTENRRYEVTGTLALEAAGEIERLRAALERIAARRDYQLPSAQIIARAALNGQPAPGKEEA